MINFTNEQLTYSVIALTILFLLLLFRRRTFCGYAVLVNGSLVNSKSINGVMTPTVFKSIQAGLKYIKKRGFDANNGLRQNKVLLVQLFHNRFYCEFEMGKVIKINKEA